VDNTDMEYGAITLDTSIFDSNGLKLETGLIKKLDQFKAGPANFLISEIVLRELSNHLLKRVRDVRGKVERAIDACQDHLVFNQALLSQAKETLLPQQDDEAIVNKRLTDFIENTGLFIVPADNKVNLTELIDRYFQSKAPFGDSSKRSEFPDAIALMSLEAWARDNKTKVIAVSGDKDWAEFGNDSEYVDVVTDLAGAIAVFQPHNIAYAFCLKLAEELPRGGARKFREAIDNYLSKTIPELNLTPDASADYYFDADYVEVTYNDFEFVFESGKALLQPVEIDADKIVIESKIIVKAEASCSFDLSMWDSIDKEYFSLSSTDANVDLDFETELLITLTGNFDEGLDGLEIDDFEILSIPTDIDFGYIQPDYGDDE